MSTLTSHRVSGDVDDTIVFALSGVEDLSTVTASEAHVWKGATRVTLDAAVTDPVLREVTVECGHENGWLPTAAAGVWYVEIQLSFGDGTGPVTWPGEAAPRGVLSGSANTIIVRSQGDPSP